jgi:hypothetical protein
VFSCLSADIVAHEMSHALLDGLHRRFQEASNPDVPAFHEAFADIVALFQHFTIEELVRFEIAKARGQLSGDAMLGGLAKQFGEAVNRDGPLRNYVSGEIKALRYADTRDIHARGSILVSAVYTAFLTIFEVRTVDLVRIATSGAGVLPEGALHPDLVNRLTKEACNAARHVLRMCIRALDYCPAVDITFGEYLRALITADIDALPDDQYRYRLAFIEAFRKQGMLPPDVRTVSEETLSWNTLEDRQPEWLKPLRKNVDLAWDRDLDRSQIFAFNEKNRWGAWEALKKAFQNDPKLLAQFGLLSDVPRFDNEGNVISTPAKGETTFEVLGIRRARLTCFSRLMSSPPSTSGSGCPSTRRIQMPAGSGSGAARRSSSMPGKSIRRFATASSRTAVATRASNDSDKRSAAVSARRFAGCISAAIMTTFRSDARLRSGRSWLASRRQPARRQPSEPAQPRACKASDKTGLNRFRTAKHP